MPSIQRTYVRALRKPLHIEPTSHRYCRAQRCSCALNYSLGLNKSDAGLRSEHANRSPHAGSRYELHSDCEMSSRTERIGIAHGLVADPSERQARTSEVMSAPERPRPESNRGARICSPLRHHSATWPHAPSMYHGLFPRGNGGGGGGRGTRMTHRARPIGGLAGSSRVARLPLRRLAAAPPTNGDWPVARPLAKVAAAGS